MATNPVITHITFDHFPQLSKELEGQVSAAIRKAALDTEAHAKATVPVRTGNLKNSLQSDIEEMSAEVGTPVEYAPFVEFGTRHMAARAYLGPAFELVRPPFLAALERLLR